jgi:hypothetical protein
MGSQVYEPEREGVYRMTIIAALDSQFLEQFS